MKHEAKSKEDEIDGASFCKSRAEMKPRSRLADDMKHTQALYFIYLGVLIYMHVVLDIVL